MVGRAYLDIFMEICSPIMPLGAYIKGYRCISPVLHLPLPGRTLSSPALANGKGREADILRENCRFMRTGSNCLRYRFFAAAQKDNERRSEGQREGAKRQCTVFRMTFLVTIDTAGSRHHRRSCRRSEGSEAPYRFSAPAFFTGSPLFPATDTRGGESMIRKPLLRPQCSCRPRSVRAFRQLSLAL